jgi:hypothetical protein
MRKEKPKSVKSEMQKGRKTANSMEIQEIIRDYIKNLHSNKFENLKEMDRFLDAYNHPKLN